MDNRLIKISKFLSYVLRHHPEKIGIKMSQEGWVDIRELIEKSKNEMLFDFGDIKHVVDNNDKKRFALSDDMCSIRASQGHSIEVDIDFKEVIPPKYLYHGTTNKSAYFILKEGLQKKNRHHIHLSFDQETAANVGARRGAFVILKIEAMKMRADGYKIYISDNGVYLTDEVPAKYICKE